MSENAKRPKNGLSLGWLELSLLGAGVALTFQLFPELWRETLWAIDLSKWSTENYTFVTVAVLLALVGIRFVPQLAEQYRERSEQLAQKKVEEDRVRAIREQKETLQRIKEGMKRRLY